MEQSILDILKLTIAMILALGGSGVGYLSYQKVRHWRDSDEEGHTRPPLVVGLCKEDRTTLVKIASGIDILKSTLDGTLNSIIKMEDHFEDHRRETISADATTQANLEMLIRR